MSISEFFKPTKWKFVFLALVVVLFFFVNSYRSQCLYAPISSGAVFATFASMTFLCKLNYVFWWIFNWNTELVSLLILVIRAFLHLNISFIEDIVILFTQLVYLWTLSCVLNILRLKFSKN